MTQRTERRKRFWTCEHIQTSMVGAAVGQSGQDSASLTARYTAVMGRSPWGATVARTFVNGIWFQTVDAGSPIFSAYSIGIGWAAQDILASDMPDVGAHAGDYYLHDCRILREVNANSPTSLTPFNWPGA